MSEVKVIQIGQMTEAKYIEDQINFFLQKGMKLQFMTDKFMVFVYSEIERKRKSA